MRDTNERTEEQQHRYDIHVARTNLENVIRHAVSLGQKREQIEIAVSAILDRIEWPDD